MSKLEFIGLIEFKAEFIANVWFIISELDEFWLILLAACTMAIADASSIFYCITLF